MKKLESNFKNILLVMLLVTSISAVIVTYVYAATKDIIASHNNEKAIEALKEIIMADFDNNPMAEKFTVNSEKGEVLDFYPAKNNNKIVAYAVKAYSDKAYEGKIELMLGINAQDGSIMKYKALLNNETPGLGSLYDEPPFKTQFEGLQIKNNNLKVKKDGGEIDAITGATITSRAVCDAVLKAYRAFLNIDK